MESGDGFEREIRFAVVMYGGVSLAIYMNGIAQELLRMVRATAPKGDPADGEFFFRLDDPALDGTERIYRRLGGELKARFVVDIISGTSAGGINGVFLAKALAHNRPLDQLQALWVQEGDVARLLNDRGAAQGAVPDDVVERTPASLLSGNRFYWELLDAMEQMDAAPAARELGETKRAPYVDEIDLFVTATDFQGANLPLELFDATIEEPVHRKQFRFRYRKAGEAPSEDDDFARDFNPMLAFAARCTASFPAAFSPFKLEDIDRALEDHPAYTHRTGAFNSGAKTWEKFFREYPEGYEKRYFVDGGYLDNKPFEAAVAALSSRHHVLLPVERKLLYIEPDPERRGRNEEIPRPDVLSTLTAVSSLPRVETIRAEIDEVTRRNRVYDRASILVAAVEEDAKQQRAGAEEDTRRNRAASRPARERGKDAAQWALKDLQDLVKSHGLAYGGYHRLKVSSITDWLARCLFEAAAASGKRIDEVRDWVRDWRDAKYETYYTPEQREDRDSGNTQSLPLMETRLLIDLDVAYRLRRLEFVRIKLRELLHTREAARCVLELGLGPEEVVNVDEAEWRAARKPLIDLQRKLDGIQQRLMTLERACLKLTIAPKRDVETLRTKGDVDSATALLNALAQTVGAELTRIGDDCRRILAAEMKPPTPYLEGGRKALVHLFGHYDDFDLVGFPLLYCLGTEDLAKVDVLRVSAADTKLAPEGAKKLAGVRLGHFGAFLDPRWRENDIFWGRLDGAERLIATVAGKLGPAVVERIQNEAFEQIVAERRAELPAKPAPATVPVVRPRAAIAAEVRRLTAAAELPPEQTLRLLGRSTAIVRKMVGGVSEQRGLGQNIVVGWALRLLLVIWGIVEAAVPQSLIQVVVRYWLSLVMLAGGLLVGVGYLIDRGSEMAIGGALIVVAGLLRLIIWGLTSTVARPSRRARWGWLVGWTGAGAISTWLALPWATATVGTFDGVAFQLAHDHERLVAIFGDCTGGCRDQVARAIGFDFWLLLSYGIGLYAAAHLVRALLVTLGSLKTAAVAKQVASAALIAMLADAVENAGMLTTLALKLWTPLEDMSGTERLLAHLVPALTYASSVVKWSLLAAVVVVGVLALFTGLGAAALRKLGWLALAKQESAAARALRSARRPAPPPAAPAPPAARTL